MHSAVMQNKKYIKFASESTVEVLALGGLQKNIEKGDPRAAKYKGADGAEYLVNWPNLTAEQIEKLNRSKANSYNKSGGIPYTCLVDPFTEKQIKEVGRSSSAIIKDAVAARANLIKQHGKPKLSRKDLALVSTTAGKLDTQLAKGKLRKAMDAYKKLDKKAAEWPELAKKQIAAEKTKIVDFASKKLEAITTLAAQKPIEAKRQLSRLIGSLGGTGLEEQAKTLFSELKQKVEAAKGEK